MIRNQWYAVLRSRDVNDKVPTPMRRNGMDLVAWRDSSGEVIIQSARCPHKGANMGTGRLRGDTIACPYHDFRFDRDGTCVLVPCLGEGATVSSAMSLTRYPCRESHGLIWFWWGDELEQYPDPEVPSEIADDDAVYATSAWTQPVNYTRYVESLLDFYHVPVVHRDHWFNWLDYFGMAGRSDVKGFSATRERYYTYTLVQNSKVTQDDLTLRHTFDLVSHADADQSLPFKVTFSFPGMIYIYTYAFYVAVWAAPIDDDNTHVIFRWFEDPRARKYLKRPGLRRLLPQAALFFQKRVQEVQDMDIVKLVEPRVTGRGLNRFVAVDELNAKYIQVRERLLQGLPAEGPVSSVDGSSDGVDAKTSVAGN